VRTLLRHRPSASMVIACIALFAALGGVGYAAATIDSGDIVNNSVTSKDVKNRNLRGKDVRNNALGGGQINESKLGKVPSAASADSAANAQNAANAANAANATNAANAANAAALNGGQIARIDFRRTPDNTDVPILSNFHGLTIEAVCETGANLVVSAINSATGRAAIRMSRTNADGTVAHNQDSDMSNGDSILLKPNDPPAGVVYLAYGTQSGAIVTAVLNITEDPFTVDDDCLVSGTATGFPQP
jgi:hypothetical protein